MYGLVFLLCALGFFDLSLYFVKSKPTPTGVKALSKLVGPICPTDIKLEKVVKVYLDYLLPSTKHFVHQNNLQPNQPSVLFKSRYNPNLTIELLSS